MANSSAEGSSAKEKIAFFDVDHTITKGATVVPFAVVCARRKMIKRRYFLLVPFFYILYRFFSIRMERLFDMILPHLKGVPRDVFLAVGEEAFEARVKKRCYKGAVAEIRRLKDEGVRVALATSSTFEAVACLARYCGVAEGDVIASRFRYEDGVFTGRLQGIPVFASSKRNVVFEFMRINGVDASECAFYSDSVHDLPLLSAVGRPVAVNPDRRLRREAQARGWEIKRFK